MKIAIIGHKRIPSSEGGIEKGVEQHAIRMVAKGHEVTAYNRYGRDVFNDEKKWGNQKQYRGIRIVTIPTIRGPLSVPIYSFLATVHAIFSKYDVISYRASGSCVMIPIAKIFGIRCVASLHGIDSQRAKWGGFAKKYLELGEKMASEKSDACLVLSNNMKTYIREKYSREAIIFANGIDMPIKRNPEQIKKIGLDKDNYILSLGRIVPEKGIHYLIEAFKSCDTEKKLVIAGGAEANSSYYNELKTLAKGDERIQFIGYVCGDIIGELYTNAYMFMLPSDLEGMANCLLEAMSYGNCCLISDIPENTEVVEDKAIKFKANNVSDLKKKLQFALNNKLVVETYKNTSADYILNKYNWDRVVLQMLEIYTGNLIEYSETRLH